MSYTVEERGGRYTADYSVYLSAFQPGVEEGLLLSLVVQQDFVAVEVVVALERHGAPLTD